MFQGKCGETYVIGRVGNDHPSSAWDVVNVTAGRVGEGKLIQVLGHVKFAGSGAKDKHVVAVQVYWVTGLKVSTASVSVCMCNDYFRNWRCSIGRWGKNLLDDPVSPLKNC